MGKVWEKFKNIFIPNRKEKKALDTGVIGFYDSKPFHNFKYALRYANEIELFEEDMIEKVEIYTRCYKGVTFVNVLVFDEKYDFDVEKMHYDNLKPLLESKGVTPTDKSIVLILFQHKNENTISMCKKFCTSDKNHFEQACVYNAKDVQMDFYRPVPKFYKKMYDIYCEDLYFDLAFLDREND